jgi:tRNA(Ser,Leu) C12 N-acetylase TAN1
VDLDSPQLVVMVQVVKSSAALCVLDSYAQLRKYNLRTLTTKEDEKKGVPRDEEADGGGAE